MTTRFLALLADQPEAAATMLDPQGMVAIHDIGGRLTVDNLMIREMGCVMRGAPTVRDDLPARTRDDAVPVATHWLCPTPDADPVGRPLTVTLFVKGQLIANVYLEFADTTEPWPPR